MKRYIHNEYIPDITERYPEGMRDVDDYDDIPDDITISDALDQFKRMIDANEVQQVEVYDQVGNCWCITRDIDTAIQKLTDLELINKLVLDATCNNGLIVITWKNHNWRG